MLLEWQFEFRNMPQICVRMETLLLVLAFDITCDSNSISCHQNGFSTYKFHM